MPTFFLISFGWVFTSLHSFFYRIYFYFVKYYLLDQFCKCTLVIPDSIIPMRYVFYIFQIYRYNLFSTSNSPNYCRFGLVVIILAFFGFTPPNLLPRWKVKFTFVSWSHSIDVRVVCFINSWWNTFPIINSVMDPRCFHYVIPHVPHDSMVAGSTVPTNMLTHPIEKIWERSMKKTGIITRIEEESLVRCWEFPRTITTTLYTGTPKKWNPPHKVPPPK